MSKLNDLIKELCPNGVAYKALGEVCEMKRGTSITKKQITQGNIPVVSGGKEPAYYCDKYNRDGEIITVAGSGAGAGFVKFWNEPIFVCDAFSVKGNDLLKTKFVYYCMINMQNKIYDTKKGGGVPHVHISSIENFKIPVPPIEVQEEIVRILDKFEKLETELAAELAARKKQYEFYRNQLLSFDTPPNRYLINLIKEEYKEQVKKVRLGDVCEVNRGKRLTKSDLSETEKYPVYHGGLEPLGYYSKKNRNANTTMIINVGASAGTVGFCNKDFWSSDGCFTLSYNDNVNQRFLYHLLKTNESAIVSKVRRAGIPTLDAFAIENLKINLSPIDIQNRIVEVLDNFDKICNDLQIGLPKEIKLRNKQYEFYRNSLLNFSSIEDSTTHTHTTNS